MRILLLLLLLITPAATFSAAGRGYAVVVSSSSGIDALSPAKVRDIFLKKRSFEGDVRLVPVNLVGDEVPRREFENMVLQMDRDAINKYWINNHFQGISPPATQASLQSVKRFVESVEGAIGYLPLEMVDESVKVIYEF